MLTIALPAESVGQPAQGELLDAMWTEVAQGRFEMALAHLSKFPSSGTGPDGREAKLAGAAMLLVVPPTTDAKLDRADAELAELASGADELAAAAAYLRARIEAVHRRRPSLQGAKQLYLEARSAHPGSRWAELAGLRWLSLHLVGIDAPADPIARLEAGEELAARWADADVAKNFHLLMAHAWARLAPDRQRILHHLLAADALGIVHSQTRADVWCAIGNNAVAVGRRELARQYFGRYLAEYRRDARRHAIETQLAELEGGKR